MTLSMTHDCMVRTHHLPLPYVYHEYLLVPAAWQHQIYGEVKLPETTSLCPTHAAHADLAIDAAVGFVVFGEDTPFNRRQFGRELWGIAEDAAFWLRERRSHLPEEFEWRLAPTYSSGILQPL